MWIYPPDSSHLSKCRGCGRLILWSFTAKKKKVPLNPDFKILGTQKIGAEELIEVAQEASHFATCPKATDFKRRK